MGSLNAARDQQIAAKARLGQSHDSLAAEYRLTRQRISQIVTAATPRSPEESQRAAIAARLRQKWDELQKIVDHPPEMHSAIGKIVIGSDGNPVINASAVVQAIKAQLAVEVQFRQMFGTDLATRPGPVFTDDQRIELAKIAAVQQYRNQLAPMPAIAPPPPGYAAMPPQDQARDHLGRLRAAKEAQDAAIAQRQAEDDDQVIDAEIVDDD